MAQLLASVGPAFELATARPSTNVFIFNVFFSHSKLVLPPGRLSVSGLPVSGAATLLTLMPTTGQLGLTRPGTLGGGFRRCLRTFHLSRSAAATAWNIDNLETWSTLACVACVLAPVTAVEKTTAFLGAMGDFILAGLSRDLQ